MSAFLRKLGVKSRQERAEHAVDDAVEQFFDRGERVEVGPDSRTDAAPEDALGLCSRSAEEQRRRHGNGEHDHQAYPPARHALRHQGGKRGEDGDADADVEQHVVGA